MLAPDQKPTMRSYLDATKNFASGKETPRAFLERSLQLLDSWEPRIGAFVCTNLPAARAAAEKSTERWRAGKPLSPIDGMPVGIKDIIETVDMPTEMGSPLFAGWQSEQDAASVRGAARGRRGHRRQDGDDRVRGIASRAARAIRGTSRTRRAARRAARPPPSRSACQRGARHPGDRLDHPAGELLRLRRLQADASARSTAAAATTT